MKRLAALCGALVLTLALAAPAAAAQKVWIPEFSGEWEWVEEVSLSNGWDFECTEPIWYKGDFKGDLWLWYPNSVDEADMMPEDEPWPWTRGMAKNKGVDTFASNEDISGKVLRSTLRLTTRMYDHEINGNNETWRETLTGEILGISSGAFQGRIGW